MDVAGAEPTEAWGRVLAAAGILGGGTAAIARIGGAAGDEARRLLAEWQALGGKREARARAVAAVAAQARAPVPARGERVHGGWVDAAIGDDARGAVAWRARNADAVAVWWQRRVTAGWIELPEEDGDAVVELAGDLARWPVAAIEDAMRRVGLAVIAHATVDVGDVAVARIAAGMTADDGAALVARARRLRGDAALRATMGSVRAAATLVKECEGQARAIGAMVIAAHAAGDAGVQVRLIVGPAVAREMVPGAIEVGWDAIRGVIGP